MKLFIGILLLTFFCAVNAENPVSLFPTKHSELAAISLVKINSLITQNFPVDQYKNIKAQVIYGQRQKPDHVLVYLFSKKYHKVDIARVDVNESLQTQSVVNNYNLSAEDLAEQPGISAAQAVCPDDATQFVAFSPNYDELEQSITQEVADAAKAHHLKVATLLLQTATRANYLNYMACPNLIGNFYDGDANSQVIITYNGAISFKDIDTLLANQFKFKTVNIWLACEAYNNPLKHSMLRVAQSQKYAAGKNDLAVGPSDRAAACAMEAAMDGKPLKKSFRQCYKKYDEADDLWGFGGLGSNYFGV